MYRSMHAHASTPSGSRLSTSNQTVCPINPPEPLDTRHEARVSSGTAAFESTLDALIKDVVKDLPASQPGRSHDAQSNQLSNSAELPSFATTKCYMDEEARKSGRPDRPSEKGSITSTDWRYRKSHGDQPHWEMITWFNLRRGKSNQRRGYRKNRPKSSKRSHFSNKEVSFKSQDPSGRVSKRTTLSTSAPSRRSNARYNSSPIHPPASDNAGGRSVSTDSEDGPAKPPSDHMSRWTKPTRRLERLPRSGTSIKTAVTDSV